ncbi:MULTISPECIES: succinate dehydrogenase, hydrophobic membrane anchor protein [Rhodomicrobium]|uniref:succinate dehydrogenase, hydrophobic membrane anchor protein n=1 Tax=Rhodomicrobium TaxID=1068 RepID=UPI000B4A989E|nr:MULTISPECIES: succinate dehydrogenase, hydrophobic membrane anchor protein [Rhodomicrobium]
MNRYGTPLKRVRGLGSAQAGTEHFWGQRLSAVANLFLVTFLIYSVIQLAGEPLDVVRAYFRSPVVALLAALFAFSSAYHMRLGMQVIIEDYVHANTPKFILLILNTFFAAAVALTSVIAIIKLSLGA